MAMSLTPAERRLGIPYAFGEVSDGKLIRICPECGERCPESTDRDGEQTTNSYAEHYAAMHESNL